jgi:hypothetical protein
LHYLSLSSYCILVHFLIDGGDLFSQHIIYNPVILIDNLYGFFFLKFKS